MTKKQRNARLQFAREHVNWTVEDWKNVIFTDESTFEIGKVYQRERVLRKKNQQFTDANVKVTFKSGRKSLMVWGGISGNVRTSLHFHDPPLEPNGKRKQMKKPGFNTEFYLETLEKHLKPVMTGTTLIFQHDNAPIHKAKKIQQWLKTQNFETIVWPASSPDMNPIEHIWAYMKYNVSKRFPGTYFVDQLKKYLTIIWQEINDDFVESYFQSMPLRMEVLLKVKGGNTRW